MLEYLVVPIEWKADGADDGNTLVGYASTFGNIDLGRDVVVKGAFTKTIGNIKANGIPLLADHMPTSASLLGTIYDAEEDSKGLMIKARISSAPSAQDTAVKLREGHLSKLSIGYETMDDGYEDRDGMKVRLLKEIKLWETSVVVFPMNPEATINRVKSVFDALEPEQRASLLADLEEEAKTASPSHSTAVQEGAWDAGANVGRLPSPMSVAVAKREFALYNADAVENGEITKAACSLPHHFVGSNGQPGAASLNGVRNALARLSQVQGYSDADKAAAERHLQRHLDAAPQNTDSAVAHGEHGESSHGETTPGQKADPPNAGDEPASASDEGASGYDKWTSRAVLAGRPIVDVDPVKRAELSTRLQLAESQLPPTEED